MDHSRRSSESKLSRDDIQDNFCPSPELGSTEILHRRSINSLFAMHGNNLNSSLINDPDTLLSISDILNCNSTTAATPSTPGASQRGYGLNSRYMDYPKSPEYGHTPANLMPQVFPPADVQPFASMSEMAGDNFERTVGMQRSSPDSENRLSLSSSPTYKTDTIVNLMNYLNINRSQNMTKPTQYSQINGYDREYFGQRRSTDRETKCTWTGQIPTRMSPPMCGFSAKVFLGGLPWDVSEGTLMQTFRQFCPIGVEWPGKEQSVAPPKGYVYMIFESEKQVRALLQASSMDGNGNWYYRLSSKRMRSKEVQIIPWAIDDSNYVESNSVKLDPSRTVFVGALHGMLSAEGLAKIMNDLFDGVVYAGIDTDKYKYPIGSGRVTFNNITSYMRAVSAAFVEIKTEKFTKKVQIDPYLEDSICSICNVQQGPYFCRDPNCFRYFCRSCWQYKHAKDNSLSHKPLMRNSRSTTVNHSSNGFINSSYQTSPSPESKPRCYGSLHNHISVLPRFRRNSNQSIQLNNMPWKTKF